MEGFDKEFRRRLPLAEGDIRAQLVSNAVEVQQGLDHQLMRIRVPRDAASHSLI